MKHYSTSEYISIFKNFTKQKVVANTFKNIVLARIANPQSKATSVDMLEEDFNINQAA